MTPLDAAVLLSFIGGLGVLLAHHQVRRARQARIRLEARAFSGRVDDTD